MSSNTIVKAKEDAVETEDPSVRRGPGGGERSAPQPNKQQVALRFMQISCFPSHIVIRLSVL